MLIEKNIVSNPDTDKYSTINDTNLTEMGRSLFAYKLNQFGSGTDIYL
jgi:hypothetical protein